MGDRCVIGLPSPSPDTGGREEEEKNVLGLEAPFQSFRKALFKAREG